MNDLSPALLTLLVALLGALTALIERVRRDLSSNTRITTEAKEASNGRLKEVLSLLAAERNRTQGLRELIRERDDRLAFLTARAPQASELLETYRDRRTRPTTRFDMDVVERRLLDPDLDDPTGTEAGAHPRG